MKNDNITKLLAFVGTLFAGLPILITIIVSIIGSIRQGELTIAYWTPAEHYLDAIVGGLLLLGAALRAKLLRKPVIIGLSCTAGFFAVSQAIAYSTDEEVYIIARIAIIAALALYTLSVLLLTAAGIALIRKVFKHPSEEK